MTNGTMGEKLKVLRENAGLSQAEIARRIGVGRDLYNKYERAGVQPSNETLVLLSRELSVTSDYLLGISDDSHTVPSPDDEFWNLRREMAERPEMKTLFSLGKNAKKEHIELANNMLMQFRRESGYGDDE